MSTNYYSLLLARRKIMIAIYLGIIYMLFCENEIRFTDTVVKESGAESK